MPVPILLPLVPGVWSIGKLLPPVCAWKKEGQSQSKWKRLIWCSPERAADAELAPPCFRPLISPSFSFGLESPSFPLTRSVLTTSHSNSSPFFSLRVYQTSRFVLVPVPYGSALPVACLAVSIASFRFSFYLCVFPVPEGFSISTPNSNIS